MNTMTNSVTNSTSRRPSKPSWQSKTLWLNVIAIAVAVLALPELATVGLDPKILALITAVLNIGMRFITNEPVSLTGSQGGSA